MNVVISNVVNKAKENLEYISNLKKIGERVYDNIYGKVSDVSIYRVITSKKDNTVIGYEKSNCIGQLDQCSRESTHQLCVTFPRVSFIPNHALKQRPDKYPSDWNLGGTVQMYYPFRYKSLSRQHPYYSESLNATCRIYDCEMVYLMILEKNDYGNPHDSLFFVMKKTLTF